MGSRCEPVLRAVRKPYQLKVTYRASDDTAVEVRVINEKS